MVVSFDSAAGEVAATLAGSPAVLAEPGPVEVGPVGQMSRGIRVAASTVSETEAVLIWPGRLAWVDAETVTSLIEAFGVRRQALLRPVYEGQPGWPVLVPIAAVPAMESVDRALMPDAVIDALARVAPSTGRWTPAIPASSTTSRCISTRCPNIPGPPEPWPAAHQNGAPPQPKCPTTCLSRALPWRRTHKPPKKATRRSRMADARLARAEALIAGK